MLMSTSGPIHTSEKNFENDVLKSDLPVLVDFWAEWCGPCRTIGPIIEELAKEYEGKMRFVKLDIDTNGGLAQQFSVQGIPTLIFFRGGSEAGRIVGAAPKNSLVDNINKILTITT